MPDIVFVRANPNAPVREGDAVVITGPAIPGTGAFGFTQHQTPNIPSGNSGFAQTVLSGRFRNHGYYFGASGDQPDNPTQPIF